METLYDKSSLILNPGVYDTGKVYVTKPFDGSGDLTFTRTGDTATRVNSDGLVEKVRQNFATYSEAFDNAAWTKINTSVTANTTANPLDGAVNADRIIVDSTNDVHRVRKSGTIAGGLHTYSVYAKANGYNYLRLIENQYSGGWVQFNLSNGTTTMSGGGPTLKIEALANGWYRCSMIYTYPSTAYVIDQQIQEDTSNQAFIGDNSSGVILFGGQFETGDIATDYIPTTSAAVSVGPVANLPRIDYTGGACGKLLLEPQTSSLCLWSEKLDQWTASGTGTVTNNTDISPDGYQNADTLNDTDSGGYYRIEQNITTTVGQKYTASVFIKKASSPLTYWPGIQWDTTYRYCIFNNYTGTYSLAGGTSDYENVSVQDFGTYWRVSLTTTAGATSERFALWPALSSDGASIAVAPTGSNVFWGANVTQTSYLQSYIPTLGAAVTRGADAAYKTGISSLIGQTEGTLFVEANFQSGYDSNNFLLTISNTASNMIYINRSNGKLECYVTASGTPYVNFVSASVLTTGKHKIALAYKANDFVIYLDGSLVHTDTSGSVPTCNKLNVGTYFYDLLPYNDGINQALLFKTRLPNSDLQTLTTL